MPLQDSTETRLYVEKTIPDHCFSLSKILKSSDREEVAIMGNDPLFSMLSSFRYKHRKVQSYTVMSNEKPVAMFGVLPTKINIKFNIRALLSKLLKNDCFFI